MSVSRRRAWQSALADADDFRSLINPAITCERYEVAGSIRRRKPDVGDVDIVAIPKVAEIAAGDMFGTPTDTNLLWARLDALLAGGEIKKHIKDTKAGPRTKWGDICRAVEWRGCCYEINLAHLDNWGVVLAVRTGPEEVSKDLVTRIQRYGYRSRDGFFIYDIKSTPAATLIPVRTEEAFFKMAGLQCLPPERR